MARQFRDFEDEVYQANTERKIARIRKSMAKREHFEFVVPKKNVRVNNKKVRYIDDVEA